jgi:crossover junction endodeoxyribonuclease RusA
VSGEGYELDLPWSAPPLSLNHRRHWRANAAKVRLVRDAAHVLARQAKIGPCPRIRVTLHYRPRDRRVRDEENSVPTLKALCDGLVDAGLVADDAPRFMVKNMPVLHESSSTSGLKPRLWLVVEPIWEDAATAPNGRPD